MKTHKIRTADTESFMTYCGITDMDNPSEYLVEKYLVGEFDECTCKKCKKAFEKHLREFNEKYII